MTDAATTDGLLLRGPPRTVDQDRYFPFVIATIANKISRGGSRVYLRLFGVGIIEWRIMYVLADMPGATAQAICTRIELDKAAASRSIQVLEAMGYVTTAADPADARKRSLALTAEGMALHDRILQVAFQREQHLLEGFSPSERELFLSLLRRMHANAIEMDGYEYDAPPEEAVPAGAVRRRRVVAA